jgi:Phosphodiester glycosidase
MPRAIGIPLCLALVVASAAAAMSQSAIPPGYRAVARSEMYTGVEYLQLTKASPAEIAHVAHIGPGAPVDLRLVNAGDKLPTSPRELETTSSMCLRVQCVVGVNGDFHKNGVPAGGVISGGQMLRSPDPGRPQLTVANDGHLVAGTFPWGASFSGGNGAPLTIDTVNADPPAGGLALFTPAYGAVTSPSGRTEVTLRAPGPVGGLNRPLNVDATGLRSGAGPIPSGGAVLSGDGAAAARLADLWAGRPAGTAFHGRLQITSPIDAAESLGAYPVVLHDGQRALPWNDPNVVNFRQPHTLVGWNQAGDVYLVAADGRQQASEGMTMAEAADFLLGLGVTEAVSLDGGGGTTFVAGGSVWNRPSDNDPAHPADALERGAVNAFVVTTRPGEPLPPKSPPPPPALPPGASSGGTGSSSGAPPAARSPLPGGNATGGLDGGTVFPPASGNGAQIGTGEFPVGPEPAGDPVATPGSSPADAGAVSAAGRMQPARLRSVPTSLGIESGPPARAALPVRARDSTVQTVTTALQAPIAFAAAVTADLLGATTAPHGPWLSPNVRNSGALAAAATCLTALARRRRRRRSGCRPTVRP